jgi:glycosidase
MKKLLIILSMSIIFLITACGSNIEINFDNQRIEIGETIALKDYIEVTKSGEFIDDYTLTSNCSLDSDGTYTGTMTGVCEVVVKYENVEETMILTIEETVINETSCQEGYEYNNETKTCEIDVAELTCDDGYKLNESEDDCVLVDESPLDLSNNPTFIGVAQYLTHSQIDIPEWMDDSVMYEVNIRQYTTEGTFNAFKDELPRLKELGVEVLWFMPIHEISVTKRLGSLGSYYAITDYYSINPEFGSLNDFEELVDEAKSMGFKIVLDIVFNHTGWDHEWILDHPEYYIQSNGVITYPETWQDVAHLDTSQPEVIEELSDVLTYWVSEFDIDGFRCDYAGGVEASTWEILREDVEAIKSDIFFLAEDSSNYSWFDTFNANYGGWSLHGYLTQIASGSYSKTGLTTYLRLMNSRYPIGAFPLNFVTNHDMNSWEFTLDDHFGESLDLVTMLTFTLPGMPLIYSGMESSLEHQLQFFEKDEINWNNYDRQPYLEKLIDLKISHPALFNDNFSNSTDFLYSSDDSLFAFVRFDEETEDMVIVLANLSDSVITSDVHFDHYTGLWVNESGNNSLYEPIESFTLNPFEYIILTK